jgi:hypothetical protein
MSTSPVANTAVGGAAILLILLFVVVGVAIYFTPLIIAVARKKSNVVAIGALNVLLGWSLIGWVVALVWALSNEQTQTIVVQNVVPETQRQLP